MPREIHWHDSLDSTMKAAAALADAACPSGTVVGADTQTAGQGRLGRQWHSPSGTGLYFTVVLRLKVPAEELPVVTLALGLAVKDAVELFAGVTADLRWPNDVMVNGRKLAGILTVLHNGAVLAGIGINVGQAEFPPELATLATSLRIETGTSPENHFLLRAVLSSIDSYTGMLASGGVAQILRLFTAASTYAEGMRVIVDLPGGPVTGITAGLTPSGHLRLRRDDGTEAIMTGGGVRPAPED
jgi:BirA family biotin operon repressor/biotin-[acetyl-CoA-carboxylase] ligase